MSQISLTVDSVRELVTGRVWEAAITPADVRGFGRAASTVGQISVLGLSDPKCSFDSPKLSFDPRGLVVLNLGSSSKTVFVLLAGPENVKPDTSVQQATTRPPVIASSGVESNQRHSSLRDGDRKFLSDVRIEMPPEMAAVGCELIETVRRQFHGDLREGLHRKHVNSDNFFAVTIQPRDQSFAIYVKGSDRDFGQTPFEIKPDRPTYSRFKLTKPEHLKDAIRVIVTSGELYARPLSRVSSR